jgi:acyl dehydratase
VNATVRLPRIRKFPVEAGHIQVFARAIGDPNPIYADPDYAAKSALGGIIAPPTFSEAGNHFDEDWPYRPRWEHLGLASAATSSSSDGSDATGGTAMHAETHFVYHRPARPGMILSVRARPGREWKKWGARSGELHFHEIVSEFHDADGTPVLDCTTVVLRTARKVTNTPLPKPAATSGDDIAQLRQTRPEKPLRKSRIEIGDRFDDVLVQRLSRTQIAQYAGVSGDFSPQHVDEHYNTHVAGYPSVFAHGMLTMGMAGRVVTDFIGDGRLRKFGFQFRQQVWPGDSLFAAVAVTGVTNEAVSSATLAISVTNQHGQLIGSGYADATVDD